MHEELIGHCNEDSEKISQGHELQSNSVILFLVSVLTTDHLHLTWVPVFLLNKFIVFSHLDPGKLTVILSLHFELISQVVCLFQSYIKTDLTSSIYPCFSFFS